MSGAAIQASEVCLIAVLTAKPRIASALWLIHRIFQCRSRSIHIDLMGGCLDPNAHAVVTAMLRATAGWQCHCVFG
eukprot:363062-Chlamydomonas_euryale.AAC.10